MNPQVRNGAGKEHGPDANVSPLIAWFCAIFVKSSPLRRKKPDASDIRLFALFQSRSRDAAAVPMAEAFGTGLHTQ